MRLLYRLACLGLWLAAGAAGAGEPGAKAAPEHAGPRYVVITQERVPLNFGDSQIGELAEGTRAELREVREDWCRVRVSFGQNWFEGWVRKALTAPDTLADVAIKVAPTRPLDVYRDPVDSRREYILAGQQFLEVKVKLEPTEKSPERVYLDWSDERTANVYLRYGREGKALPYGFIRRVPGMTRATFEREEKRQTILLKPGEAVIETYVFVVPVRARDFDLVLKDVVTTVPIRR